MITVVISDWCVPHPQVVRSIAHFSNEQAALTHINAASEKWWRENNGDKWAKAGEVDPYEAATNLSQSNTCFDFGEIGWCAMIDAASYAALHEAYYKREFDDKGFERPGYQRVSYLQGNRPKP